MRKIIGLALILGSLSSFAVAATTDTDDEVIPTQTNMEPMLRNCNSSYLGNRESCWTTGTTCPPSYDGTASYCWSRTQGHFYRCGTVCDSIFRGGH